MNQRVGQPDPAAGGAPAGPPPEDHDAGGGADDEAGGGGAGKGEGAGKGGGDAAGAADDSDPTSAEPFTSALAAAETRKNARWLIGALAAAASVVFGAGPLIAQPDLNWETDRIQLLVALSAGVLGIAAVVLLIMVIAEVLQPARVTLAKLPPDLVASIDANAEYYLPSDVRSLREFRLKYAAWKQTVANLDAQARLAQQRSVRPSAAPAEADKARRLQAYAADNLEAARRALALYDTKAALLLDEARFEQVRALSTRRRPLLTGLAVAAGALAVVYQLALSEADDASGSADAAVATSDAGLVGYLPGPRPLVTLSDGRSAAGDGDAAALAALHEQLGLEACAIPVPGGEDDVRVPVLITAGSGTGDDPWHVTTLDLTGNCRPVSFTLTDDIARLVVPQAVDADITYTPRAEDDG